MTFTDDDLRRWRDYPEEIDMGLVREKVSALIARLEAAEKVIEGHCRLEQEKVSYDNFVSLSNTWRKAAGK